ncbi:MAG: ABC transporter permease [Gemmatimonadota bacterium]|nr:ABC transporter permease [Gemmatimonadota bacterium]
MRAATVTSNAFEMLGQRPLAGRTFLPEEDQPGHDRVAVLSEELWKRRFGSDPRLIGRTITLDGEPYILIGVMPARFEFPVGSNADLWTPLAIDRTKNRGNHYLSVVGRLKTGVTIDRAATQMKQIAARLAKLYPDNQSDRSVLLKSYQEDIVGNVKPALFILLGAVGFVLLIACANVANLLLARAASRRKDIAIRTALGASRWRLITQLLTESLLLAFAGGALGMICARWGTAVLVALAANALPRATEIHLDSSVFAFLLVTCVATGIGFGLVPALHASRSDLRSDLTDGGSRGGSAGPGQQRVRNTLVIAEIALALVLLVGAGLLMRGFIAIQRAKPGFSGDRVLTMHLASP